MRRLLAADAVFSASDDQPELLEGGAVLIGSDGHIEAVGHVDESLRRAR